ncbi:HU family DNA-binding protein [Leekyejoonella antrihumi]|uniref:HU family DNA-binding protein n=1 Tax=Leekyejoonella antrihumi TaxID=1660198 RepID=A0A563E0Q3_9MICO|nr:HU family DNA-binding protein [Leekyejoonella antrihumi]TWP36097.1 HU family DNA-binding protein [Leekyejoonella antrihumi]
MPDPDLVQRIADSTGLSLPEASRVVDDVLTWHREPVADYVRRRHLHLKTYGMRNAAIFEQIAAELAERTVAAPPLSARQLRRIVYG